MESTSTPGRIQVSEATHALLTQQAAGRGAKAQALGTASQGGCHGPAGGMQQGTCDGNNLGCDSRACASPAWPAPVSDLVDTAPVPSVGGTFSATGGVEVCALHA